MSTLIIKSGTTSISGGTVKGDFTYFSATTKGLGATIDTGFWSGVDPTCNGYTIYKIGGQHGWAAMVATGREQLNDYLILFGGTGSTTDENVTWATNSDNILIHSGSTGPCPTVTPTPTLTPTSAYVSSFERTLVTYLNNSTACNASDPYGAFLYLKNDDAPNVGDIFYTDSSCTPGTEFDGGNLIYRVCTALDSTINWSIRIDDGGYVNTVYSCNTITPTVTPTKTSTPTPTNTRTPTNTPTSTSTIPPYRFYLGSSVLSPTNACSFSPVYYLWSYNPVFGAGNIYYFGDVNGPTIPLQPLAGQNDYFSNGTTAVQIDNTGLSFNESRCPNAPTQTPTSTPTPSPTSTYLQLDIATNASLDINISTISVNSLLPSVLGGTLPNTPGNGTNLGYSLSTGTYTIIVYYSASITGQRISVNSPTTGYTCQNTSTGSGSLTFTGIGFDGLTPVTVFAEDGTC